MNEKERAIRQMYRTDLTSFIRLAFNLTEPRTSYVHHWSIELLGKMLQRCHAGEVKRLIINLPPRYLKSFCASIALPAWSLALRPESKITCIAGSRGLADDQHQLTRKLMNHSKYRALFPHIKGWYEQHQSLYLPHGGRRSAFTLRPGSGLTGRGADMIIIDDPLPAGYADDEDRREQVNKWYDHNIYQRLDNKEEGVVIVVMQRIAHDDLTGHLLEHGDWTHVTLPALATTDEQFPEVFGERVVRREGEALQPHRESREQLRQVMLEMGAKPFMAQYQQAPYPPGKGEGWQGAMTRLRDEPDEWGSYEAGL